jgi:nicotinate dehydrogenase subunit A
MAKQFALAVNGKTLAIESEPDTPLLYVLRNDAALSGPKFGCGLGQCGACTVILDGVAVRSCITPIASVGDAKVTTLEGLGTSEAPHRVQQAFMDEQAAQCGYCTNGMIMAAKALLHANPNPRTDEVKQALAKNLCRCGSHLRIVRAVLRAASTERGQ